MLSKCANSSCTSSFHYLRDGRLFQMETGLGGRQMGGEKKRAHRIEYFWLCSDCAAKMTLSYEPGKGVVAVPHTRARGAIAS
jgi:hypothetical protein